MPIAASERRQPRRVVARALGLSGTALLAAALLAWTPQPATGWDQSSAEATVWQLLNGARVNNGRNPLTQQATLVSLARWRSQDMVDRDYFDHVVLGTGYQVYHWYDTNGLKYVWAGENIGWNNGFSDDDSPVKIHEGFMASDSHRTNMLEPSWTHGGVGAYGADNVNFLGKLRNPRAYTQLFMQAQAAAPPPPAPPPPPAVTPPPPAPPPPPAVTPKPTSKPAATTAPTFNPLPTADPTASPTLEPTPSPTPSAAAAEPVDPGHLALNGSPVAAVASLRVQAAAAAERGIFETVLGSLLGFFLG